jgi:hypothetical protein
VDKDLLGWWLAERQVKEGGLNGRPEKLADVRMAKAKKHWEDFLSLRTYHSCNPRV